MIDMGKSAEGSRQGVLTKELKQPQTVTAGKAAGAAGETEKQEKKRRTLKRRGGSARRCIAARTPVHCVENLTWSGHAHITQSGRRHDGVDSKIWARRCRPKPENRRRSKHNPSFNSDEYGEPAQKIVDQKKTLQQETELKKHAGRKKRPASNKPQKKASSGILWNEGAWEKIGGGRRKRKQFDFRLRKSKLVTTGGTEWVGPGKKYHDLKRGFETKKRKKGKAPAGKFVFGEIARERVRGRKVGGSCGEDRKGKKHTKKRG